MKAIDDLTHPVLTAALLERGCWLKTLLADIFAALPSSAYTPRFSQLVHVCVFQFTNRAAGIQKHQYIFKNIVHVSFLVCVGFSFTIL